jgi:hypothetical protein
MHGGGDFVRSKWSRGDIRVEMGDHVVYSRAAAREGRNDGFQGDM